MSKLPAVSSLFLIIILKNSTFSPLATVEIQFDYFFWSPGKVHTKRKTYIKKKVHLGNKKFENAVFAALPRPLATMSVHQKIFLAHTLNSPDLMNKTKKESTPKDQHRQHAVQKRCDSEMPTEKNSARLGKGQICPFKHWYISGYLFKCAKNLGAYLTWPELLIVSSRKYFEQKSVAKVAQSIEAFKFRTATVINRGRGCMFAPLMEKRCINILKVRNLGKQYAHQIWSHTVQNPWRYAPEGCLSDSGFLAK